MLPFLLIAHILYPLDSLSHFVLSIGPWISLLKITQHAPILPQQGRLMLVKMLITMFTLTSLSPSLCYSSHSHSSPLARFKSLLPFELTLTVSLAIPIPLLQNFKKVDLLQMLAFHCFSPIVHALHICLSYTCVSLCLSIFFLVNHTMKLIVCKNDHYNIVTFPTQGELQRHNVEICHIYCLGLVECIFICISDMFQI